MYLYINRFKSFIHSLFGVREQTVSTEGTSEQELQSSNSTLPNCENQNEETALVWACKSGRLDIVRYLLNRCQLPMNQSSPIIPLNENDRSIGYPLHAAVMSGNLDLVRFLVEEQNVDVTTLSEKSKTLRWFPHVHSEYFYRGMNSALHYGVYYLEGETRESVVQYLTEKGVDMWIRNRSGKFAWEMTKEPAEALKLFIELGLDVNHQDELTGETIAHCYARKSSEFIIGNIPSSHSVIQVLKNSAADFKLMNNIGMTPFMVAAFEDSKEQLEFHSLRLRSQRRTARFEKYYDLHMKMPTRREMYSQIFTILFIFTVFITMSIE